MQEIREHLNVIGQVIDDYRDESISDEVAMGLIAAASTDWISKHIMDSLEALKHKGDIL